MPHLLKKIYEYVTLKGRGLYKVLSIGEIVKKVIKQFQFYSFVVVSLMNLQIIGMNSQEKEVPRGKEVPSVVNVTLNLNNNSEATAKSYVTAENNTGISNNVENRNENRNMFTIFFAKIPVRKYGNLFASYISNNCYKLIGISLICIYLYLVYKVIKGNNYLGQKDSWALWKHDFSLAQLLEIPQEQLSKELILEIQRRYTSIEKPLDFISSLIAFMRDIDQEIACTKHFINLEAWICTLHIALFFPINKKIFSQASEHLSRLFYIRNLFSIWVANYKIYQNDRIPLTISL